MLFMRPVSVLILLYGCVLLAMIYVKKPPESSTSPSSTFPSTASIFAPDHDYSRQKFPNENVTDPNLDAFDGDGNLLASNPRNRASFQRRECKISHEWRDYEPNQDWKPVSSTSRCTMDGHCTATNVCIFKGDRRTAEAWILCSENSCGSVALPIQKNSSRWGSFSSSISARRVPINTVNHSDVIYVEGKSLLLDQAFHFPDHIGHASESLFKVARTTEAWANSQQGQSPVSKIIFKSDITDGHFKAPRKPWLFDETCNFIKLAFADRDFPPFFFYSSQRNWLTKPVCFEELIWAQMGSMHQGSKLGAEALTRGFLQHCNVPKRAPPTDIAQTLTFLQRLMTRRISNIEELSNNALWKYQLDVNILPINSASFCHRATQVYQSDIIVSTLGSSNIWLAFANPRSIVIFVNPFGFRIADWKNVATVNNVRVLELQLLWPDTIRREKMPHLNHVVVDEVCLKRRFRLLYGENNACLMQTEAFDAFVDPVRFDKFLARALRMFHHEEQFPPSACEITLPFTNARICELPPPDCACCDDSSCSILMTVAPDLPQKIWEHFPWVCRECPGDDFFFLEEGE